MGTSLTPEFWRMAAVLLVLSTVATFVVSALLDALVVRAQRRRALRAHPAVPQPPGPTHRADRHLARH